MSDRAPDALTLEVDGRIYGGWQEASVARSLDRAAADFDLLVTERWGEGTAPWPIAPFAACRVLIGEDPVLTGFVDAVQPFFDARGHGVRVSGRSRTADLVDCTPEIAGREWRGTTLDAIARAMAEPFNVEVVAEAPMGDPIDLAVIEPAETAWDAIERLARLRGVLATDDGRGRLVLTRASDQRLPGRVAQGENVLAAQGRLNVAQRFSRYVILTQRGTTAAFDPEGEEEGEAATPGGEARPSIAGVAEDRAVPRYRPKVTMGEQSMTAEDATARALWQAAYAAGRSLRASVTVQGWRQADGALWPVNRLLAARLPWLQVERDLLIAGVTWTIDGRGRRAELDLAPAEGFTPEPVPAAPAGGSAAGGGSNWDVLIPKNAGVPGP